MRTTTKREEEAFRHGGPHLPARFQEQHGGQVLPGDVIVEGGVVLADQQGRLERARRARPHRADQRVHVLPQVREAPVGWLKGPIWRHRVDPLKACQVRELPRGQALPQHHRPGLTGLVPGGLLHQLGRVDDVLVGHEGGEPRPDDDRRPIRPLVGAHTAALACARLALE
jgi:hypothetical protein